MPRTALRDAPAGSSGAAHYWKGEEACRLEVPLFHLLGVEVAYCRAHHLQSCPAVVVGARAPRHWGRLVALHMACLEQDGERPPQEIPREVQEAHPYQPLACSWVVGRHEAGPKTTTAAGWALPWSLSRLEVAGGRGTA